MLIKYRSKEIFLLAAESQIHYIILTHTLTKLNLFYNVATRLESTHKQILLLINMGLIYNSSYSIN